MHTRVNVRVKQGRDVKWEVHYMAPHWYLSVRFIFPNESHSTLQFEQNCNNTIQESGVATYQRWQSGKDSLCSIFDQQARAHMLGRGALVDLFFAASEVNIARVGHSREAYVFQIDSVDCSHGWLYSSNNHRKQETVIVDE